MQETNIALDQTGDNLNNIDRILVILPTFNEADTLPLVLSGLKTLSIAVDVLVVDDSSSDGTADLVRLDPDFSKQVFLISRPRKMGLGSAYKAGFKWALSEGYDICVEMDSDLSHDPNDVPKLIDLIKSGADMAIGSRYCDGISVVNWPLQRLLLSLAASFYVRFLLRLPIKDATSGFKALHRKLLEKVNWNKIKSEGYGFQIELKYLAHRQNFHIEEASIIFTERRNGQSKISRSIVLEAIFRVLQLGIFRLFLRH
jgi:dolichol-phosphate mannosyltransferase